MKHGATLASSALAICLLCVGCERGSPAGPVWEASADPEASDPALDAGPKGPKGPKGPVREISRDCDVCCVGDTRQCQCSDGSAGMQVCAAADGRLSQCSCKSAASQKPEGPIAVPPPPPPKKLECSHVACLDARSETSLTPTPCCTESNVCGSSQSFLFGKACLEQNVKVPIPKADPGCPDEFPTWLDLIGCCTPEGRCGLYFQGMTDWTWGCVERSRMAELLNEGSQERDALAQRQGLTQPARPDYGAIGCEPH